MARTLTDANAVIHLSVPDVFPSPVQIQQFSTDDMFAVDDIDIAQVEMGVDGVLSAGYTPKIIPWRVMLQANSPSVDFFEQIYASEVQNLTAYVFSGSVIIPAVQKSYILNNGYMTGYSPAPSAGKILKPRTFTLSWQSFAPNPTN